MVDHLSIRVWPSDSTSRVFSRVVTGPKRVPSGCPVRMILIIARTALTKNRAATIRKTTLIVPRTICNGPVMLFLPHTPGGVGSSHPPHGEGLIVAARRRPHRPGAGGRIACGRRCPHGPHDSWRTLRLLVGNPVPLGAARRPVLRISNPWCTPAPTPAGWVRCRSGLTGGSQRAGGPSREGNTAHPGNTAARTAVSVGRKVERTRRKADGPLGSPDQVRPQYTEERPAPWLERSVSTSAPPTPSSPSSRAASRRSSRTPRARA